MDDLRSVVGAAEENARSYGAKLEHFSGNLDRHEPEPALGSLVSGMLQETRAMEERNRTLEDRLAETTAEVKLMREDFEQARCEALSDSLTGLANRKNFEETRAQPIGRAHV